MTAQIIQLTIPGMAGRRPSAPSQYQHEILLRTKSARIVSGLTREQVCEELTARTGHKVNLATYKKWETRTPIPHFFIIPFCDTTRSDPYMLLTGIPFQIGRNNPGSGLLSSRLKKAS